MNYNKLLISVLMMLMGIGYLTYNIKNSDKYPKVKDQAEFVFRTKTSISILILFILGLLMLISELNKIL